MRWIFKAERSTTPRRPDEGNPKRKAMHGTRAEQSELMKRERCGDHALVWIDPDPMWIGLEPMWIDHDPMWVDPDPMWIDPDPW